MTNEEASTVIREFYDDIETCHGIFREGIKMRRPRTINKKTEETRDILFDGGVKSSCLGHRVGPEQITLQLKLFASSRLYSG